MDELIAHMKEKGIKFEKMPEEDARKYLMTDNYYFKLSAYRANYPKCSPNSVRDGQYENLDFAYLRELSDIDRKLRYHVLEMCLDIEHSIKAHLIESVTEDGEKGIEDGYRIVKEFLKNPNRFERGRSSKKDAMNILRNINYHKAGEYCRDLYNKYYPYFPIWVLMELISFGDLLRFVKFYDDLKLFEFNNEREDIDEGDIVEEPPEKILLDGKFMNIIRDLRNASAHSNCLLNKAAETMEETKQPDSRISNYISNLGAVSTDSRRKYLRINFTYNIVVLLYVYQHYMGEEKSKEKMRDLQRFLAGRVIEHADYFQTNPKLTGVYGFMKKVIDKLAE